MIRLLIAGKPLKRRLAIKESQVRKYQYSILWEIQAIFTSDVKCLKLDNYLNRILTVLLNSLLNPFIYCLRLPEIHTEAVKQLHKLFSRSSPTQWTDSIDWIWAYRCPVTLHTGRLYFINLISQKLSNLFPVCGWTVNLVWHRKRIFNVSMQVIPCVRTVTQSLDYSVYRHTVLRELQDSLYPVPI